MLPELSRNLAANIYVDVINSVSNTLPEIQTRQERELGHATDVTNWITLLSPNASAELLMAGWLHDWERLVDFDGATGFKGDRNSSEYLKHKKDHAKRSAELAETVLQRQNWLGDIDRVKFLISHHDDTGEEIERLGDEELMILAAADSFSFFTYIAPDMLEREGEARLQDKANFMVNKMSPQIRELLRNQVLSNFVIAQVRDKSLEQYT